MNIIEANSKSVSGTDEYAKKIQAERETFSSKINVHDLPDIYHYWSNKYLLPTWQPFGFVSPDSFFCNYLVEQAGRSTETPAVFLSIGSGNCDTEVRLAEMLITRGLTRFTFECLDLNEEMLARGRELAASRGISQHIVTTNADFNTWQPTLTYHAVLANQSLHHIQELETVFAAIKLAIGETGVFLTSDMIGRNGHMRWPRALDIVREYWCELPGRYRYNHQLSRYEEIFQDWDCSNQGFEGIRAQDVLPQLCAHFQFSAFFTFANLIDPFIDRGFGHNFDMHNDWDRDFIHRVHLRDQLEFSTGGLPGTHILAAMRSGETTLEKFIPPLTPQFCLSAIERAMEEIPKA